jgi:hypothetical protein
MKEAIGTRGLAAATALGHALRKPYRLHERLMAIVAPLHSFHCPSFD